MTARFARLYSDFSQVNSGVGRSTGSIRRMELWERRRELGIRVAKQHRLSLDLRFWNDLCDAELGIPADPCVAALLAKLRRLVAIGELVCPVEFHLVEELYKQRSSQKRLATIALIDELSSCTVLVSAPDRVFLEVLRFIQGAVAGAPPTSPPLNEVWTRPLFAAGHSLPELEAPPGLPPIVVEQLREELEAEWWEFGFAELFARTGDPPLGGAGKAKTAELLNSAKGDPTTEFKSFEATYWSEVRGTLDAYQPQLEDVGRYLFQRFGGDLNTITADELQQSFVRLRAVLYNAARRVGLKGAVPSLHIGATLYSHIQWDRRRVYKPNDVFDFDHAEAALPYFDAFATDGSLAALLRRSGLEAEYGCVVASSHDELLAWLERYEAPPATA